MEKLVVLWCTADRGAADNMVLMYTLNAKRRGWWDDVTLIIWGPSAELLAKTPELREKLKEIISEGITVEACLRCADNYGVSGPLRELGVDVKLMGEVLTGYLKEGRKLISV